MGLEGPNSRNSLLNSLLAGNFAGDRRDLHCIASQAVRASALAFRGPWKRPQTADFRALAVGLHLPIWPFWQVKSSRVSRRLQKCSRFRETAAGDLVRSRLPGEGGSCAGNPPLFRLKVCHGRGQLISIYICMMLTIPLKRDGDLQASPPESLMASSAILLNADHQTIERDSRSRV